MTFKNQLFKYFKTFFESEIKNLVNLTVKNREAEKERVKCLKNYPKRKSIYMIR